MVAQPHFGSEAMQICCKPLSSFYIAQLLTTFFLGFGFIATSLKSLTAKQPVEGIILANQTIFLRFYF